MEPRCNHGQPNWLGTWLQDRCHQLASRRLRSDVTYGERNRDTQRGDSASPVCPIAAGHIRPHWVDSGLPNILWTPQRLESAASKAAGLTPPR
jgi:hypothetical protein